MINKNIKKIFYLLVFLLFLELLSFNVFLAPVFALPVFIVLNLLVFGIAAYRLEYGLLIAFVELIIGSKGYLFFATISAHLISIRMSIWSIVVSLGFLALIKMIFRKIKNGKFVPAIKNSFLKLRENKVYLSLAFLFFFIFLGILFGFLNNKPENVFEDFNAYLYFLYLIPVYSVYLSENSLKERKDRLIFLTSSAVTWVSIKSLFLLYYFSHGFLATMPMVYKWVRDTGVGEITKMKYDFYRIFFQSHIYVVLFFLVFLTVFLFRVIDKKLNKKEFFINILYLSFFLSVVILSYSRTNWLGLFSALGVLFIYILFKFKIKKTLLSISSLFVIFVLAILFLLFVVNFPFPSKGSSFSAGSLLDRASSIKNEAGVSSRWSLLPKMTAKIGENPLFGSGFGTEIVYRSSDPRVVQATGDGMYRTFSFEWGWLEFIIKIGFFGFLSYFSLMLFLGINYLKDFKNKNNPFYFAIFLSIVALFVIHFFSPYLNHPLGIGIVFLYFIFLKDIPKRA